ncbi:hypothetical protein F4778DRAFT_781604 [Xylariomycetidae sp. FL2044]|nr:hypothetical protein F4778DRAFT_781604 [Xylariomycetidae sp. FL2044]
MELYGHPTHPRDHVNDHLIKVHSRQTGAFFKPSRQCTLRLQPSNIQMLESARRRIPSQVSTSSPSLSRHFWVTAKYPDAKTSIRKLDLSDVDATHALASAVAADVSAGTLSPLTDLVCTAPSPSPVPAGAIERSLLINHVAHAALVLRLLGSFEPAEGGTRILLFTSDGHRDGVNALQNLNRHLEKDQTLNKITAIIADPGNMPDSRVLQAAVDMAALALNRAYPGERGYLHMLERDPSSEDSVGEAMQELDTPGEDAGGGLRSRGRIRL